MLITYADSMGKNVRELHGVLDKHYKKAVGGVHILLYDIEKIASEGGAEILPEIHEHYTMLAGSNDMQEVMKRRLLKYI